MHDYGVRFFAQDSNTVNENIAGKSFVLTGTLATMSRDEAKERIRAAGGKIVSQVSKKTDYVVVGTKPGSKAQKAKEYGVKMLSEDDLRALLET